MVCDLCGVDNNKTVYNVDGCDIRSCMDCGLVFADYPMGSEEVSKLYGEEFYTGGGVNDIGYSDYEKMSKALGKTFRKRLKLINRYLHWEGPQKPKLLEIGCGLGFFLKEAKGYYDVMGIEMSAYAAKYAREHFDIPVIHGSFLQDIIGKESFDVIALWDTIEHLPSPGRAIEVIGEALKKDGLLVLTTGDYDSLCRKLSGAKWHLFSLPEHLFFFTPSTILKYLHRAQLAVLEIRHRPIYCSFSYLAERLSKTYLKGVPWIAGLNRSRLLDKIVVPVNLYDVMTVVAKKH